jgi:HEAT repeat protein
VPAEPAASPSAPWPDDPVARAVAVRRDARARPREVAALATTDPDTRVRVAALGAIVERGGEDASAACAAALTDPDAAVRRRAAEHAARIDVPVGALRALLDDRDATVVEAAAWALGERAARDAVDAVDALAACVERHPDPLAREAAVAALGAIGDRRGLAAILTACGDKPAVRRRAVLALAPFSGPEVDAALATARDDRDWQVRQAAEDLLGEPG